MQQRERVLANPGMYGLQSGDEVSPEECGVIVALIK